MRVDAFDYDLPESLIAQDPIEPRDSSRLLIMNKSNGEIRHSLFRDVVKELHPGDMLVLNDTKVLPARLYAYKDTGAVIELLLLKQTGLNIWQCMVRPGKKVKPGVRLSFALDNIQAEVVDYYDEGTRLIRFECKDDFYDILEKLGTMPLPPYIKKPLEDQSRYQPVYARERGSAAAPTAGLHFTDNLLSEINNLGVSIEKVLLHVGLGTFRPVKVDTVEDHVMHSEFYRVTSSTADAINKAKQNGGRIIAVGTTAVRTLETLSDDNGVLHTGEGWTNKFIYPGYKFKIVDGMITNFHLPKSTLLMLVSAFAGYDNVMHAYKVAINESYRFFSFGDACLFIDEQ